MKLGRINAWPAFADMVFVLFICTLIVAVNYRNSNEEARQTLGELREEMNQEQALRSALEEERQKMLNELGAAEEEKISLRDWIKKIIAERDALLASHKECGGAGPLLTGLRSCLGIPKGTEEDDCSVKIGEALVRFRSSEASFAHPKATYQRNARRLARCLAQEETRFWKEHREDFDKLKSIYIDGHTDCKGQPDSNVTLGYKRARELFKLYRDEFKMHAEREGLSAAHRRELERKVNVRSFGENLPTKNSPCQRKDEVKVDADRRVTISVEQKVVARGP